MSILITFLFLALTHSILCIIPSSFSYRPSLRGCVRSFLFHKMIFQCRTFIILFGGVKKHRLFLAVSTTSLRVLKRSWQWTSQTLARLWERLQLSPLAIPHAGYNELASLLPILANGHVAMPTV